METSQLMGNNIIVRSCMYPCVILSFAKFINKKNLSFVHSTNEANVRYNVVFFLVLDCDYHVSLHELGK